MTAKAALCKYLLEGKVLNIKNCFTLIGLTNCPREISRMIEQPFGVIVSRTNMTGQSRFGQSVTWINYRLNRTEMNKEGIEKMKIYLAEQMNGSFHKEETISDQNEITTRLAQIDLFGNVQS